MTKGEKKQLVVKIMNAACDLADNTITLCEFSCIVDNLLNKAMET